MKIFLVVAAFLTLTVGTQGQLSGTKGDERTQADAFQNQEADKSQGSGSIVQDGIDGKTGKQEGTNRTEGAPKPSHDWIDKVNAFSTCVIAAFTVLLFVAVVFQIKTSRNIERAWLIANLEFFEHGRVKITEKKVLAGEGSDHTTVVAKLTCTNSGRSLARVKAIYGRADIGPSAIKERPRKSTLQRFGYLDPIAPGGERFRAIQIRANGILKKDEFIFLYVLIEYTDVFGCMRETSMGYTLHDDAAMYLQEALPERNTNT